MTLGKNTRHPNFILGALSFILLILGVIIRPNNYLIGTIVVLSAVSLGAIHWIWSIITVTTRYDLNPDSRIFWLILVVLIPPLGGMIYYLMKRKNISI